MWSIFCTNHGQAPPLKEFWLQSAANEPDLRAPAPCFISHLTNDVLPQCITSFNANDHLATIFSIAPKNYCLVPEAACVWIAHVVFRSA